MLHTRGDEHTRLSDDALLLVEEMQHRVANEYALAIASINLFASGCDQQTRSALRRAIMKLHDFAEIHRVLRAPTINEAVDLCSYLQILCAALTRAVLQERGISLILRETCLILDARSAWRVGLILSELITNAARHGRWPGADGVIEVVVELNYGNVCCRVSDNGGEVKVYSPGRGTEIIDAIARKLGGQFHREFGQSGMTNSLVFPYISNAH